MPSRTDRRRREALEKRVLDSDRVLAKPWDAVGVVTRRAVDPPKDDIGLPVEKGPAAALPRFRTGPRTAPAQKTGVTIEGRRDKTLADQLVDATTGWIGIVEKGLGDYLSTQGRDDAQLGTAIREAFVASVHAEGVSVLKRAPFASTLTVAVDLAAAFADGAASGIVKANAKNAAAYDVAMSSEDIDEETYARLLRLRQFQAINASELGGILREAFASAATRALGIVGDRIGRAIQGAFKQALKASALAIAKRLASDNAVLAALNVATTDAIAGIPGSRRKIEAKLFTSSLNLWLGQMRDTQLRAKLKEITNVDSDEQIDIALLASLIEFLEKETYAEGARRMGLTPDTVREAEDELKRLILDTAHELFMRIGEGKVAESSTGVLEQSADRLLVPPRWYAGVSQPVLPQQEVMAQFAEREKWFSDYVGLLSLRVMTLAGAWKKKIERESEYGSYMRADTARENAVAAVSKANNEAWGRADATARSIAAALPTAHGSEGETYIWLELSYPKLLMPRRFEETYFPVLSPYRFTEP
jgi:hypothetical protein